MSDGNELQRLESFVTRLLSEFDTVRKENEKLQKELNEKNSVIAELNEQLTSVEVEREEIGQRVARIISQFENWEKDLAETDEEIVEGQQVEQEIAEAENHAQEHDLFGRVHGYGKE